jgi:hypothetical protein
MPLKGAVIKAAPTSFTVVGGTDETLSEMGTVIPGGLQLTDNAVTDFYVRPVVTVKAKPATRLADGTYSRMKNTVTFTLPKVLASGKQELNNMRIEFNVHPETTVAEKLDLRSRVAQLLFDTDFTQFWDAGTLS